MPALIQIITLLLQIAVIGVIAFVVIKIYQLSRLIEATEQNTIKALREELYQSREETNKGAYRLREEIMNSQNQVTKTLVATITQLGASQKSSLDSIAQEIKHLTATNETRLDKLRETMDAKLKQLQDGNEAKLEEMRKTVDEKLHVTLEKRLGESFKLVSQQLEAVQSGLGEMRNLASGVGDLKKVLTNVKTRGTFGEIQLGAILEEILSPDQYAQNVKTKEDSREVVEYAVKLPGPSLEREECVYLPIDAKFPQENYQRLVDALDAGNIEEIKLYQNALVRNIKVSANDIQEKYLNPPQTTDFGIMFLPTEGLYAEVLKSPGLVDELLRVYHVVVAGPTTLAAILSSLRMGFKTLAIEKRSSDVWKILGAVKTEFGKYGLVLDKLKTQLATASRTVDETGKRTKAMERKLSDVEKLPESESSSLLQLTEQIVVDEEEEEENESN